MSGFKGKSRRLVKKFQRFTEETVAYLRLNFSGNRVQKLADFRACEKPVLLVYGFGATRLIFSILEKRLRKDGYCVFSVNLGGLFDTFNIQGIVKSAKIIQRKIDKLYALYNLGPLTIIGHSKGGLIGEYYVKYLNGAKHAVNLITLATPHRGSPWAFLGLLSPLALVSASIRQMWPLSPFIRSLNRKPMPENVHFVSIYSKNDAVCPYPFCKLNVEETPKYKNIEMEDVSHCQFFMNLQFYEVIREEIQDGFAQAEKATPEKQRACEALG